MDALKELKVKIEKANKLADTKKIVSHIDKVIQYNKLLVEGLKFQKNILKIVVKSKTSRSYIMSSNESNIQKFSKLDKKKIIGKVNLEIFLTDILPKNIFNEIFYQKEFNNNKEVNKTNKKIVTRESKSQVKDKCDARVFTNMQLGKTYKRWEKWENKPEDKKLTERFTDEVKELKDLIKKYKKCGCSKCQIALEDGNLKRLIDDGFFQNL